MKQTTLRVGTAPEFFERGRRHAQRIRAGEPLPESALITFEDPVDMMRVLSPAKLKLLRALITGLDQPNTPFASTVFTLCYNDSAG